MKKIFKRFLIAVASIAAVLMMALVIFVAIVWYRPGVVWQIAENYLLPSDLKVTWQNIHFEGKIESLRHWTWNWDMDGLSITKVSPEVQVGAKKVVVRINVNIATKDPWFEFEEFKFQGDKNGYLKFSPSPEAEMSTTGGDKNIYQQLQSYYDYLVTIQRNVAIHDLKIDLTDFSIQTTKGPPWVASLRIEKPDSSRSTLFAETVGLQIIVHRNDLRVQIEGDWNYTTTEPKLRAQIEIAEGKNISIKTKLEGSAIAKIFDISGTAQISYLLSAKKRPLNLDPSYKIKITPSFADLSIKTSVTNIPGIFAKLDSVDGEFHLPLSWNEAWSQEALEFKISTGLDLFLIDKNMRPPLEKSCQCKFPEVFVTSLYGKAWPGVLLTLPKENQPAVDAHLQIDSVKNKLLDVYARADLKANRQGKKWEFIPSTNVSMVIHSFRGMKNFLDAKGIIVPAPLDILDGKITFVANDKIVLDDDGYSTDAKAVIELGSKNQKVLVETQFKFYLVETLRKLNIDIDVLIKDLRLELPPIDPVLGVPSLAKDSRILTKPKETIKKGGLKIDIAARARTEHPGAVHLLSEYAKPFVPLTIHASTEGQVSNGEVSVEPFRISYLRRVINVEKMKVTLPAPEEEDMPIAGRLVVEQGGYKIFIDVTGALQAPALAFSSEPYLPRSDIISVLLYGRVNDQLVSGDAETAGRFDAAVTDRAIGLVGLWAFATTPIQSFSYNSVTKVYTATVKLGAGLTAGVGTNWEKATNFEVRKRLSQRWALTASWSPTDVNEQRQQGRLVLQWENRF
jgi:hypothetical protein